MTTFVGSAYKKAACFNARETSVGPNLFLKVIFLQVADMSVFQHGNLFGGIAD